MKPIPHKAGEWSVSEYDMRGLAMRLAYLQTHYRSPLEISAVKLNAAAKIVRRWLAICIPNNEPPPVAVLEALCDDLNTAEAVAQMHRLAKAKDGKGLFRAMCLMGLIPGEGEQIDYGMAQEIKTIPIDHLPMPQWRDSVQ